MGNGNGSGNGNRNGNSSRVLRLPPAAGVGQNRHSNAKTLLLVILFCMDQGDLRKAGRERKVLDFLLSTKVAALFFFFFFFMSTVNLLKIWLDKTKYEWIKLKSVFVLITAF